MTVVKKKREEKRRSRSRWCRSFDRKRSGLQVSLANVSRVGNARKKKGRKKKICWLLIFQQGVATKRDETRPDFSFVRMSRLLRRLSGRVEARGRPNQVSLSLPRIPLPGGPTRAHPAVSKWLSLTFSLFFFSHHCSPFQTHTHTHFLPHHHTHPLSPTPSLHHFSGMRRHFLSRPVLKQHMCVCDSGYVIHQRLLHTTSKYLSRHPPEREKKLPIWTSHLPEMNGPGYTTEGTNPAGCEERQGEVLEWGELSLIICQQSVTSLRMGHWQF